MFFLLAVIATVAYALHNVWMAPYYRRIDQLVAVTARGFALSLALVPGLLIPGWEGLVRVPGQFGWILAASACALCGNWAGASSVRHLPMGIASALNMSLSTVVSAMLSRWLFAEVLSASQWFWIGLIFLGVFALGVTRSPPSSLIRYSVRKGLIFAVVFGLSLGCAFTLISHVSRVLHPLSAGFCWEFTIATLGALVVSLRRLSRNLPALELTGRDLGWIGVYGLPGALGTACYAAAVASGPVAIVAAVLSTMMVATALFAWLIYGERLRAAQWIVVACICCALIGMRFAGT